jgi:hypothetical protein
MVEGRALVLYFAAPLCDAGRGRVPFAQVPLDVAGLNPVESPTNSSQPLAHTAHPSLPPSVGAPAPCVDDDAGIARSSGGLLASCNVRPPSLPRIGAGARAGVAGAGGRIRVQSASAFCSQPQFGELVRPGRPLTPPRGVTSHSGDGGMRSPLGLCWSVAAGALAVPAHVQ